MKKLISDNQKLPNPASKRPHAFVMMIFFLFVSSLVEAQTTFTPGINGRFDAQFEESDCKLTITIRVVFEFIDGRRNHGGPWLNQAEKTQWKDNFKQMVENHWSGQFEFVPVNPRQIPCERVTVEIDIEEPRDPRTRHFKIKVKKTNKVKGSKVRKGIVTLDSMDLDERVKSGKKQHAAFHEFGHMLGLPDKPGSITSSQMSSGDVLNPSHYSTLNSALQSLTSAKFNTVTP